MAKKPVKLPSARQIEGYRLRRRLAGEQQDLQDEMRAAHFWRGGRGRDEVLARHIQRIAGDVGRAARRGQAGSDDLRESVEMLADQMASQALLIQALLCYLEDSPEFDKARFREIMLNLDAADGEVDGKLGGRKRGQQGPNRT